MPGCKFDRLNLLVDDHVPNPPAPNDESPCNVCQGVEPGTRNMSSCNLDARGVVQGSKCGGAMTFKHTGLRSSTMLLSPYIKKASVINEPKQHADENYDVTAGPAPQVRVPSFLTIHV